MEYIVRFSVDDSGKMVGKIVKQLVRCKDCDHSTKDALFNMWWCNGHEVKPNGFCEKGLRQEDNS